MGLHRVRQQLKRLSMHACKWPGFIRKHRPLYRNEWTHHRALQHSPLDGQANKELRHQESQLHVLWVCVHTVWSNVNLRGQGTEALIHSHLSTPLVSATSVRNKDSQGSESVTKTRKIRENRSYPISRLTKEQAVSTPPLNIQGPSPRI